MVPFLVGESIRSNVEFWRTPPGTVRFSAQLDRPITGFGYNKTKTKRKRRKPSQGSQDQQEEEENEREQEQEQERLDPDQMLPDSPAWQPDTPSWQSQPQDWQADRDRESEAANNVELKASEADYPDFVQDHHSSLPKDWGAKMADASIGSLAVIQVVYGALSNNHKGVSVVEVPFNYPHLANLIEGD